MFHMKGLVVASLLLVIVTLTMVTSGVSSEPEGEWSSYGYDPQNTRRADFSGEFDLDIISMVLYNVIDGHAATAGPIAVNLTGNATPEIVFCTDRGVIVAVSPYSGELEWTIQVSNHEIRSTPAAADFDFDGELELVLGTVEGKVMCIDPRSRAKVWVVGLGSGIDCHPVLADVVGDSRPEIFIGAYDGRMYCIGPDGNIVWDYPTGYHISNTSAAVGDIYGNGSFVCVFNSGSQGGPKSPFVYYLDAASGGLLGKYRARGWATTPIMLVDLDDDGVLETVVDDNMVVAISGINDSILWKFPEEGSETRYYRSFASGFFDETGFPSVIAASGSFDNRVALFDGPTGRMIDLKYLHQPPVCVIDIDGDGRDEVITSIGILDGDPPRSSTSLEGSYNPRSHVLVADLDLDGFAEICRITSWKNLTHAWTHVMIWDCLHRQEFTAKVETNGMEPIVFYAGLESPMNLTVTIGNVTSRSDIESFEIILDPEGEAIRFIAFPSNGSVELVTGKGTVRLWDGILKPTTSTYEVVLSISFDWSFETAEPMDLWLEIFTRRPGLKRFLFPDTVRVEHGVTLTGIPLVVGYDHGPIVEGGWCFPDESLTISGLRVVYRGTQDLVPPSDARTVLVTDMFGSAWTGTSAADGTLVLEINASGTETADYMITIANRPQVLGAVGCGSVIISLGVDGTPPVFTDHFPHEEWFGIGVITAGVVLADGNGSGPDGSTLRFFLRPSGSDGFPDDGASPDSIDVVSERLSARMTLILPDGSSGIIWQVDDHAGNRATSEVYTINVDSGNLTFRNPRPSFWVNTLEPLVSIDVVEVGGSEIDGESIEFSISTTGLTAFGPWVRASMYPDGRVIQTAELIELVEGSDNWVMWRASDLAGHTLLSSPQRILIDTHPPEIVDVRPDADEISDGPLINLTCRVLDPLSKVNLSTVSIAIATGRDDIDPFSLEWSTVSIIMIDDNEFACHIVLEVPEGQNNFVWWRASDKAGNGYHISGPHRVWVNSAPVIDVTTPDDGEVVVKGRTVEVGVEVWDPDGDPLTVLWFVDDDHLGEGETYMYSVNRTGDITIRVEVFDGHNHTATDEWVLQAVDPPSQGISLLWIWIAIALVVASVCIYFTTRLRGRKE